MPTASLPPNPAAELNVPLTDELIAKHGLTTEEFALIEKQLGRTPTLTELGIFSVMWSEHCSYKNSRPLLRRFPTAKADPDAIGQVVVKAGEENAGVIDIGDGWGICFKIESHNHPSAVEPYEGAATGVGGIVRDIFTMGARPVLLTNSLRFGPLSSPQARRLFRGVVHGISNYGNCLGIPNVGGDIYFDESYEGNPLVNALCLGVVKLSEIKRGKASGVGNPVYYVGAATGRDGLGGASFASKELSEESAADRPAVQKGDPFMEKLLLEACLEMMAVPGLVVGIQDMGAAGLTCSTCETASRGDAGIEVELDTVPQRESGMNAYEIMLSESQERMLVIVQAGREAELEAVFAKWDLHAVRVGEVKDGTDMVVTQGGVPVAHIPAKILADEAPIYERDSLEPPRLREDQAWTPAKAGLADLDWDDVGTALAELLAHPTIAEKRWVWRQYDHMVMGGTAVAPGSDAGVVRLQLGDVEKFVAIANDCNNLYCRVNPYRGAQIAIAECIRNLACSGARALAMTNNLNFGNPHKPESFYFLRECVRGLADACTHFDVPVIGGNVSLYNESPTAAIDPTPVVSLAGLIDNEAMITRQTVDTDAADLVLLGGWPRELGASHLLMVRHGLKTGDAPEIDLEAAVRLHDYVLTEIARGGVRAAHDLSEGGLLVALCEMLFAEDAIRGAQIVVPGGDLTPRRDALLFGESQNRVLLALSPGESPALLTRATAAGVPAVRLGQVHAEPRLQVKIEGEHRALDLPMEPLASAWRDAIPGWMDNVATEAS